ncbi:MAG: hypothetical protein V4722_07710 [Bacteroidota bacterium]
MSKLLPVTLLTLCSFNFGYSQGSKSDTLVEIGFGYFCREFASQVTTGEKSIFSKSESYVLVSDSGKIYFIKEILYVDEINDAKHFVVKFKPVEIFNFDKNLLTNSRLLSIKKEKILPFVSSRKDSVGREIFDTVWTSNACIAYIKFHLNNSSFEKEIDPGSLVEENIVAHRPDILVCRNHSFNHNNNLFFVSIYQLLKKIAEKINVSNDYPLK